ncbi:phosphohydrolase [Candidatus Falkowbacteria bacterium CG_4_10_14_0_2_um_filter_41_15]|uniref:Phosphohydrolase n=2 Tax=Candidatus Falkowiibacteriota TaxID=1752728 RepID=A0A2G9ZNJ4_9BACT|nr:MAG: phosphohydrolase [Candidatus Falkowbacteria bacterium CG23_combo_of_CG06-09_8_20_14_all_41_10]PJA10210.1 MAG: phosphohydrolase [Candidatus Falkowbacteria bacterium CG_4_10_14_0_2_um_filter_41_15]
MNYTSKIQKAIKFAAKTHDLYQKQMRKGKNIAYITHPLTVGIILALAGSPEDVIVAGILHDTIEDSIAAKKVTAEMLTERFGSQVADLVLSVTETDKSLSWDERKQEALEHIKDYSQESLLIKSADIISNMSETLDDYLRYGEEVFARFNAPKEKVVDHQFKTINIIIDLWPENPLAPDLLRLADGLKSLLETIQF